MLEVLKLITAGESHGEKLTGILEGMPANLKISYERLKDYLKRRSKFKGRSKRQKLEEDEFKITSGVENGITTGAPIACEIENKSKTKPIKPVYVPRPGHADFSGFLKYGFNDIRPVMERASARETAMRTLLGGIASELPISLGVKLFGFTQRIGDMEDEEKEILEYDEEFEKIRNSSDFYFIDKEKDKEAQEILKRAYEKKETLGGAVCVYAFNVPPGLGSYVHFEKRIDLKIAGVMLSIPSVKGIEIGSAIEISKKYGKETVDEIFIEGNKIKRKTNYQGGIEGGMTDGNPIKVKLYIKPIPTQLKPVNSVNLKEKKEEKTKYLRSDVCVVPAVSVIAEVFLGLILCDAILQKFGSDNFYEIREGYKNYLQKIRWV